MPTDEIIFALRWWNTIRNTDLHDGRTVDKGYYTRKYFPLRMFKFLSDSDVLFIFEKEHGMS